MPTGNVELTAHHSNRLKVSGGIVNIAIAERECPVLGEVTITYG